MELVNVNCHSCQKSITENFCGFCGQKRFKRIDKKYLWEEIQYATIHTNKGFFFTIMELVKNPGKTARAFIEGNRVKYYKPFALAFLLSGISLFVSLKIFNTEDFGKIMAEKQNVTKNFIDAYYSFFKNYYTILMLLLLPIIAFFSKLVFRKSGHNYYEHCVMHAYGFSSYSVFTIFLFSPLTLLFKNNVAFLPVISLLSLVFPIGLMVWFFDSFYPKKSTSSILIRVLLMVTAFLLLVFLVVVGGIVLYMIINGPEALQHLAPKK